MTKGAIPALGAVVSRRAVAPMWGVPIVKRWRAVRRRPNAIRRVAGVCALIALIQPNMSYIHSIF